MTRVVDTLETKPVKQSDIKKFMEKVFDKNDLDILSIIVTPTKNITEVFFDHKILGRQFMEIEHTKMFDKRPESYIVALRIKAIIKRALQEKRVLLNSNNIHFDIEPGTYFSTNTITCVFKGVNYYSTYDTNTKDIRLALHRIKNRISEAILASKRTDVSLIPGLLQGRFYDTPLIKSIIGYGVFWLIESSDCYYIFEKMTCIQVKILNDKPDINIMKQIMKMLTLIPVRTGSLFVYYDKQNGVVDIDMSVAIAPLVKAKWNQADFKRGDKHLMSCVYYDVARDIKQMELSSGFNDNER